MAAVKLMPSATRRVVVLGTGGTIAGRAGRPDDHLGYTAAQVGAADLVAGVPALAGWPIEVEQVAQVDSKDMELAIWLALAARAREHLARPDVAGLVVTHGTDTLEETAYFLHRVLPADKPVVLTSAMRPASALVPDGPQNLLDAVSLAGSGVLRGVVAVAAGQVLAAAEVSKVHTYRTDAFSAGDAGPLGWVEAGQWRALRAVPEPPPCRLSHWPAPADWPRVEVVHSHAGRDAWGVRAMLAHSRATPESPLRGLVVAGTGNGTLHRALEAALHEAREQGVTVWRTTRCAQGQVLGEESVWPVAPVAPVFKARIALMLALLDA